MARPDLAVPSRRPTPRRSRRRAAARLLAWSAALIAALALGVAVFVQHPAFRQSVLAAIHRRLEGSLRGHVQLEGLTHLSPAGARLERVEVRDENGLVVLTLEQIVVRYELLELLAPWLPFRRSDLRVDHLRVERARVRLVREATSGQPTLVRAFGKDGADGPGGAAGRAPALAVELAHVELGRIDVEIEHPALAGRELRLERVHGSAVLAGPDTSVAVEQFGVSLSEQDQRWLDGAGAFQLEPGGALGASFHGFARGTELDASLRLDAGVLSARLDVPRAEPERLRELWPSWPVERSLALRLRARGPLSALQIEGQVSGPAGRLEVAGDADVAGVARAELELSLLGLDLQAFSPGAPATSIDARGRLELDAAATPPVLRAELVTDPTSVAGLALPSLELSAEGSTQQASATFRLEDARGALEGRAAWAPGKGVELGATLSGVSLERVPELRGAARGRLDLEARARVAGGRFEGHLDGRARSVSWGPASLSSGALRGEFRGSLAAPAEAELRASLDATDARLGSARLSRLRLTGRGPWHSPRVAAELTREDGSHGTAEARLTLAGELALHDLRIEHEARDVRLSASLSRWLPASGELTLDRLTVAGEAGTLEASAQLAPGRLELTLAAERLDLERVLRRLGIEGGGARGVVTGRAALRSVAGESRGDVELRGDLVSVNNLSWRSVEARATLAGQDVDVDLQALGGSVGQLSARAQLRLGGAALEPRAWLRATGSAELTLAHVPLWPIGLLLPKQGLLQEIDGELGVTVNLERDDAEAPPSAFLHAHTEALSVRLAGDDGAPARTLEGYRLGASASIDGRSGRCEASAQLADEQGGLLTTSALAALDLGPLLRDPQRALDRLRATPLDALVRLHRRPVALLPPPLGSRDLAGSLEATLLLRGSLLEPRLSLVARAAQLQAGFAGADRAVDVTGALEYLPVTGALRGTAQVIQSGNTVVLARADGHFPNPLAGGTSLDDVELHAAAMLNGVPLDLVPLAARERIEARLYGSVALEKSAAAPLQHRAHVEIAGLSAQGHALGNGRLTWQGSGSALSAELRLGSRERFLRAALQGPAEGGDGAIRGTLEARNFHAASLSPLTSGLLSRLAGSIDADLEFRLRPGEAGDLYLGIDGGATVDNGSAHVDELGLEVREIFGELEARSTPEHTVLLIGPVRATARSRTPNLEADAELWLLGRRVVSGEANLALDNVPLSVKGVPRGIARGHARARLTRMPEHLQLEVKVDDLRVRLPPSSTRSLIALDADPDVRVLQALEEPEPPSRDAPLWRILLDLGDDLRIQRGDLDLPLTGTPVIEFQHELRPSGNVEALPGGRIRLFDQSFSIDRALLQFVPDEPDNPRVDVTASWRAPDGTTIYVDVTGRANDAKISTRDDRGLQEVERFYLLTGGAVGEGRAVADGGGAESVALGQTFSLGINEVLRDALGNVAVSIGTTPDDRASYSASVRLSDKLTFQGSFRPGSDSNLEESTNDLTGTLDYRFSRRWSLRTELGTSGGAFDLLWSHRY